MKTTGAKTIKKRNDLNTMTAPMTMAVADLCLGIGRNGSR
jgi:hypothetical protein